MAARFVLIHPDRRYLALADRVLQRSRAGVVEFYVLAFAGFAGAIVLALRGIRSVIGIVALLLAFSSFALLFIIHFG
jgi:hypothetical protein